MALVKGTNSFIDASDADTYWADRLHAAAWDSATAAQKDAALVTATDKLRRITWEGELVSSSQALPFPRTGLIDAEGNALSATTPVAIEEATAELARAMLADITLATSGTTPAEVTEVAEGPSRVKFGSRGKSTTRSRALSLGIPHAVYELIAPYLPGSSSSLATSRPYVSGNTETDGASSFDFDDRYHRTRGV